MRKMQSYITTARNRKQLERDCLKMRLQKAISVAKLAAQVLRSQFGASRVMLFGSVISHIDELSFHADSDIDLAVWGMSNHLYFKAVGYLQGLSEFAIDLVQAQNQNIPAYMLSAISQGVDL